MPNTIYKNWWNEYVEAFNEFPNQRVKNDQKFEEC